MKLDRHRRRETGWDLNTCQEVQQVCDFRGKPAVMLANDTALRLQRSKLKA